jgi:hypothetical protein
MANDDDDGGDDDVGGGVSDKVFPAPSGFTTHQSKFGGENSGQSDGEL